MSNTKKQFRYYHNYIPRFIKEKYPDNGVTSNCRDQLNSLLCNLTEILANKSMSIVKHNNKRTITPNDVKGSISIILSREMCASIMVEYESNIESYKDSNEDNKGRSKHAKAGMVMPPSICDKYLRDFGESKFMVTNESPILLCTAIEHFTNQFLSHAIEYLPKQKKRITIREFEMAREKDMKVIFDKNHLYFQGGGIVPYIHPELERNVRKKMHKNQKKRPGMLSIRDIKKFQKTTNSLMLSKSPFEKLVRGLFAKKGYENIKISKQVFLVMQYFIESRLIDIISKSNSVSVHCNRVKLLKEDLKFYVELSQLPYNKQFKELFENENETKITTESIQELVDEEELNEDEENETEEKEIETNEETSETTEEVVEEVIDETDTKSETKIENSNTKKVFF
jgi:histone H3/H4